jgi:hypothetical protein
MTFYQRNIEKQRNIMNIEVSSSSRHFESYDITYGLHLVESNSPECIYRTGRETPLSAHEQTQTGPVRALA